MKINEYSKESINNLCSGFLKIFARLIWKNVYPEVTIVLLFVLNVIVYIGVVVLAVPLGNETVL